MAAAATPGLVVGSARGATLLKSLLLRLIAVFQSVEAKMPSASRDHRGRVGPCPNPHRWKFWPQTWPADVLGGWRNCGLACELFF